MNTSINSFFDVFCLIVVSSPTSLMHFCREIFSGLRANLVKIEKKNHNLQLNFGSVEFLNVPMSLNYVFIIIYSERYNLS